MKRLLLVLLPISLFLSFGFSQRQYDWNDIQPDYNQGIYTLKKNGRPVTGKIYTYVGEVKPLKKVYMGNLLNGLNEEGEWIEYLYTGQKLREENYKDGKKDGLSTNWYKNGQKKSDS